MNEMIYDLACSSMRENFTKQQFIEAFQANQDAYYAFDEAELQKFVRFVIMTACDSQPDVTDDQMHRMLELFGLENSR